MEVLSSRVLVHPRDWERSVSFYRDVLGLAISREFPGGTVFFAGQGFLEISGSAVWLRVIGSRYVLLLLKKSAPSV